MGKIRNCWFVPLWDENRGYSEFADDTGNLIGGVKPFGERFLAFKYIDVDTTKNALITKYVGCYITRAQAIAAVEKLGE